MSSRSVITPPRSGRRWWWLLGSAIALLGSVQALAPWCLRPVGERMLAGACPGTTCLPSLAPTVDRPSWQLQIMTGYDGIVGRVTRDFTITSDGRVTWVVPEQPVRHRMLSREQLAFVRQLDHLSSVGLPALDVVQYSWLSINSQSGVVRLSDESPIARTVVAMLDELAAGYLPSRREEIGSIELWLVTTAPGAVHRVRVAGGRLTLQRGDELMIDEPMDPDLQVELVDALLAQRGVDEPDLTGVLRTRDRVLLLALSFAGSWQGPFAEIIDVLGAAR